MKIIEAEKFSFSYKGSNQKTLSDITFRVNEGELIFVCGATACGKTTLLRNLKPNLLPQGERSGEIRFRGESIANVPERTAAAEIGYVMQRPENQMVSDTVRGELAFGGESLGLTQNAIRRQVAETAAYFGLEKLLDEKNTHLSGGQRQLLNLAAVMAVNPKLIILDEPTAQLDPVAAGDFIRTLYRITRELAITVIIAEHRFEELLPLADKVMILENGKITSFGTPKDVSEALVGVKNLMPSLTAGLCVWSELLRRGKYPPPITLGESRAMLESCFEKRKIQGARTSRRIETETAIELKNVHFCYDKSKTDILCGVNLKIKIGESYALLGSNGSGKSTLLSVISGIEKPYRGTVKINGKRQSGIAKELVFLPQDVHSTFLYDTVGEELEFTESVEIYDFRPYYGMHPYDLSGGQQQLLGIKKLLTSETKIMLLDEPTKGLDGSWREHIGSVILSLRDKGMTILTVTHDMELAAQISDRCGIFFDGITAVESEPEEIFRDSIFYTTNAVKTARGIYSGICMSQELTELCRENGIKGEAE